MSMSEWAKNEVELAKKRENPSLEPDEWDYGCACYDSALKAYLSLCKDGHSGFSFSMTRAILERLLHECPLTPIEDKPESWGTVDSDKCGIHYTYCKRRPSLVKRVDAEGRVSYSDSGRYYAFTQDNPTVSFTTGAARDVVNKLFPITFPYMPAIRPFKVCMDEFLSDPKNGDYDHQAILYVDDPEGRRYAVNIFYDMTGAEPVTISAEEYQKRKAMACGKQEG